MFAATAQRPYDMDTQAGIGAALRELNGGNDMPGEFDIRLQAATAEIKTFVIEQDNQVVLRVKYWVIAATLVHILAVLPIIFFLGAIYSNVTYAIDMLRTQQAEISRRGQWMQERQRWEDSMERWAEPNGYKPLRYRALTKE